MILNIARLCPIHQHERAENGDVLPDYTFKLDRMCWVELHGGEKFLDKDTAAFG